MKPKPDPDFAADSRRRSVLVRVASMLVLAAMVAGLTLFAVKRAQPPPALAQGAIPVLASNGLVLAQLAKARTVRPLVRQSADRFVRTADPNIDPKMVYPAPAGLDDAMVHHPTSEGQGATRLRVEPQPVDPELPDYEPVPPPETVPDGQLAPKVSPRVPRSTRPR